MIPSSEFESRRQRLFDMMEQGSALLLFAGVPKVSSADEDLPFEINRNFYYLTGIDQEGSALLLINSEGEMQEFLFVLPFDERKEKWYGKRLTPEEASSKSGLQNVLLTPSLQGKLDTIFNPKIKEYGAIGKLYLDLDREIKIAECTFTQDFKNTMELSYRGLDIKDAYPLVTTLRLRKSMHEIAELRSAIAITRLSLLSTWGKLKPGVKEYELADEFLRSVNDLNGYQGLSFPTIMGSGVHGACLHYPKPLDTVKDGDLVLMDLGARNSYYCADITRTLPANGKFSDFQLMVYNIVLGCNKMIAQKARPWITINELQNATVEYLSSECLHKGLIKDKEEISRYYFHGISHLIGLDTHDPYLSVFDRRCKDIPLEPGMVISNEPGLYMEDKGLGIRIEDDLLITEDGCEVLSADIIKEPAEIERYLKSRR